MPVRVAIYGATGYTGTELLRVLGSHPEVKISSLISGSKAGKKLSQVLPHTITRNLGDITLEKEPQEDFDLAFLCLPHEVSLELVPKLLDEGKRVIDLSGAYRIKEPAHYPEYYGFEHKHPELLRETVYGLTEVFRKELAGSRLVANPGCYPTATLLALYPLLREGLEFKDVVVHALSGISGAGRKPKQAFHYPEMSEGFFSYSVDKHRHLPEMEGILSLLGSGAKIRFIPTVVPTARGMLSTVYVRLEKVQASELYASVYADEPFVRVIDYPPNPKWVAGTNYCLVYPYYDERTGLLVIQSAIDNLGKGASLQAVQNMNAMMGFKETLALETLPVFP